MRRNRLAVAIASVPIVIATLSQAGASAGDDGPAGHELAAPPVCRAGSAEPDCLPAWVKYAPEVRLAQGEKYFPMDQAMFIRNSTLRWAHDSGCEHEELARSGTVSAAKLGSGGYEAHERGRLRGEKKPRWRSDEATRPYQKSKDNPEGPEGFYLDLDNDARTGVKPSGGVGPTVYYNYVPNDYVTYWFMYGYDDKGGGLPALLGHEGEWERIVVRLTSGDIPIVVSYYQHNCPGEEHPWSELVSEDWLTSGQHPIVYASRGGHASYPEKTRIAKLGGSCRSQSSGLAEHQGGGDEATGGGPTWETWRKLRAIDSQPWYGYGGGWGEVADPDLRATFFKRIATGPMGPPHLDPRGLPLGH